MNVRHWSYRIAIFSTIAATALAGAAVPTLAQEVAPSTLKWRPKEGTYAVPGNGFAETCGEFGDLAIALRKKSVSGHEWSCDARKLTDTGPDSIRIEMTCFDYNLAEDLNKPEGTEFKEVILLRKIDGKSISVRKTVDGKFKDPEWKAVYCPKEAQQMYRDAGAENKADAEQKEAALKAAWQPRDGVYASPGADFDDRCMKSGDAVVGLAKNSLSIGGASCYVAHVSVEPPNSVTLDTNCGGQAVVTRNGSILGSNSTESVTLSRMDDQSVLFRRSRNGQLTEFGKQLTYCPEAAQRTYMDSRAAK